MFHLTWSWATSRTQTMCRKFRWTCFQYTGKTGPLPHVLFPEYFQSISIPRKTFPFYGIGQSYGNWIFQPFSTIFPKYFHIMEELNFCQSLISCNKNCKATLYLGWRYRYKRGKSNKLGSYQIHFSVPLFDIISWELSRSVLELIYSSIHFLLKMAINCGVEGFASCGSGGLVVLWKVCYSLVAWRI